MRFSIFASSACLALAACGGGGGEADGGSADASEASTETQTAEAELLANGVPAYGELGPEAVEKDEASGDEHEVRYVTDGSVAEIAEFYRDYYAGTGHSLHLGGLSVRGEERTQGGYVQLFNEGDEMMVHLSPEADSANVNLPEQLGDGFPAYPGVDEADYQVNDPRPSGSRLIIFRVPADPADILDFYAEAANSEGYDLNRMNLDFRSDSERVQITIFDQGDDRRVTTTSRPESE